MTSPLPPRRRDTTTLADLLRQDRTNLRQLDPGLMGGRFTPTKPPEPFLEDDEEGDDEDGDLDLPQWLNTDHTAAAANDQPVTLTLTYEPDEPSLQVKQNGVDLLPSEWTLNGSVVTIVPSAGVPIRGGDTFHAVYRYFSPLTPLTPEAPTAGAWYRLNEASGSVMADSSGNNRDGSYAGVTLGQPSLMLTDPDPAASWNGTTSHADVAYGSWMDTPTFSATILCKGTVGAGTLMARDDGALGRLWALRLGSSFGGGGGALGMVFGGIFFQPVISAPGTNLADGSRHLAGVSYDGATLKLYVDGVLKLTQAVVAGVTAANVALTLGAARDGSGGSYVDLYTGTLDEARFYPGDVLTDADHALVWAAS